MIPRIANKPLATLKWGLLFTFVAIAIFVGISIHEFAGLDQVFVIPLVLFAGGAALIVFYRMAYSKFNANEPQR